MQHKSEKHISQTLRHMQRSVTVLCWMAGIAFLSQVLIWSMVTFTDLRFDHLTATNNDEPPVIVQGENTSPRSATAGTVQNKNDSTQSEPIDLNAVESKYDQWFQTLHQLAYVVGLAAVIMLTIQISLGLIVASIGPVKGISRVATAQAWVMVLLILTIPWSSISGIVENVPYPGIFSNYSTMCSESATYVQQSDVSYLSSPILFYGRYALLPFACVGAVSLIHFFFAAGIRGGIIPSTPSVFEQAIDEEATGQTPTSLFSAGRTGGALQSTILQSASEQPAVTSTSSMQTTAQRSNTNHQSTADRPVDSARKPAHPPAPDPRFTAVDEEPTQTVPARRPI